MTCPNRRCRAKTYLRDAVRAVDMCAERHNSRVDVDHIQADRAGGTGHQCVPQWLQTVLDLLRQACSCGGKRKSFQTQVNAYSIN